MNSPAYQTIIMYIPSTCKKVKIGVFFKEEKNGKLE